MGLHKTTYPKPIPPGAVIRNGAVTWTDAKGERKKGKLSKSKQQVLIESQFWQIRYRDENGIERREATSVKSRESAQRILTQRESEIERIISGVVSREETRRAESKHESLADLLEKYGKKQYAAGTGQPQVDDIRRKLEYLFQAIGIRTLRDISREKMESWIVDERRSGERSPRTINSYFVAINSFCRWAVETDRFEKNPLRGIKKLNEAVDKRKDRRSLSEDELRRLFETAKTKKYRHIRKREQCELVYRLLVGTGLRSKELSLATPSQFDFERSRFTVKASATKNKRADVLPIRPELMARLKAWIDKNGIQPMERIFLYSVGSLYRSFKADCERAGIAMRDPDGRSIDVHSLRRTFGTMLARAGVPLTTTQRLMRHSTPELTAKLYIDVEPIDMAQAVDRLPEI